MATYEVAGEYFTYEARLASFRTAQPLAKRRASNASSKASKSIKWPHKSLSPEEFAKAGFFYFPTAANPDNCACFLCHRSMDGWEEDDDPLAEHLKHCPDCGWAIVASIEAGLVKEFSQEYPYSERMLEARKATFGDKWPHEAKEGWQCKIKNMVDAGWKYTPSPEYDDTATCTYCQLALDGWESEDNPMNEHYKRSPECAFFTLTNKYKQEALTKKPKSKRMSKASRLSTQSLLTVSSEAASLTDLPAEDDDSILTTITNATITKKMPKAKKTTTGKGRKTKTKKEASIEVEPAPEPEDDDFEVKVDLSPKMIRGKKRKSDAEEDIVANVAPAPKRQTRTRYSTATAMEAGFEVKVDLSPKMVRGKKRKSDGEEDIIADVVPAPKRRATRTRNSTATAVEDSMILDHPVIEVSKPSVRRGRPSKATRKTSTASRAPLRSVSPDDEAINKALQADLERPLTDDEAQPGLVSAFKKSSREGRLMNADHAMFDATPVEINETVIEAEIEAIEVDSKPLPKARGAKGKQPRKVSVKQQALAAKNAAEAEAQRLAEEEEAAQQIAAELEDSISKSHSSPIVEPKKKKASRQPAEPRAGRATRGSIMSVVENVPSEVDSREDSGNETDASMASQSTVLRGRASRRGSTIKKTRSGKKVVKNIEEIVHRAETPVVEVTPEAAISSPKGKGILSMEEVDQGIDEEMKEDIQEYIQLGIEEEVREEVQEEIQDEVPIEEEIQDSEPEALKEPDISPPTPEPTKAKATKSRGRPAKKAIASPMIATPKIATPKVAIPYVMESVEAAEPAQSTPAQTRASSQPRVSSPLPKELTPSQSPQSSDAENHPPSSKPSTTTKKTITPSSHTQQRLALAPMAYTPQATSPSKRNVIAGLKSSNPWSAADLDTVFIQTPDVGNENVNADMNDIFGVAVAEKMRNGELELTSEVKMMTVEEWIRYNAKVAEERLREECERMVSAFEREGARAMAALEGIECIDE